MKEEEYKYVCPLSKKDPEDKEFKEHLKALGKSDDEISLILALRKRAYEKDI